MMWKNSARIGLLVFVAFVVSLPILQAGFFSDDIVVSETAGYAAVLHQSIWPYMLHKTIETSVGQGRIFPLSFGSILIYSYYFQSPLAYQIARVIAIWLSVISMAWLVQLITKNIKVSLFFVLLFPVFWSMRNMSDALLSYGPQMPLVALLMMGSLAFLIQYFEKRKKTWYALSLLSYFAALMTYEVATTTFFCLAALIWLNQTTKRQFLQALSPFVLISLAYLIGYKIVQHYHAAYIGITPGHLNIQFLRTFFYQLIAALPLSFGIFRGHYFKISVLVPFFENPGYLALLLLLFCSAWFLFYQLIKSLQLNQRQNKTLIVLGLFLCIIPSFLIGISVKYEAELRLGLGYIPLYIQYIGMTFLLLCLLNKIKHWRVSLALLFSLIMCFSLIFNLTIVRVQNDQFKYPRDLEDQAIHAGLLNNLPVNAVVMAKGDWVTSFYFMQKKGVTLQTIVLGEGESPTPDRLPVVQQAKGHYIPTKPLFFMHENHVPGSTEGEVVLGQVQWVDYQNVNGTVELSSLRFQPIAFFSSFKGQQSLNSTHLVHAQSIQILWSCNPAYDVPCFTGPIFSAIKKTLLLPK